MGESLVEARRVAKEIGGAGGDALITAAENGYANGNQTAFVVASILSAVGALTVRQIRSQ